MAFIQFGYIIKNRRESLRLTQEELADGICSVPTLSRLENGERMPTKNHFEMLLQRLGYSDANLNFYVDEREFYIHELKFRIRQAYISKQIDQAKELLKEFEELLQNPSQVDEQFLILHKIFLSKGEYSNAEKIELLEKAMRLTCPEYDGSKLPKVLTFEEITLLNNLAICYDIDGSRAHAIDILMNLRDYYNRHIVNPEEALRTQPMILYNLSKMLGQEYRLDECVEICDQGIKIARTTGRCSLLGKTLYNKAWALLKRNQKGDRMLSFDALNQAYHFAVIMGNTQEANYCRKFQEENFPDSELL